MTKTAELIAEELKAPYNETEQYIYDKICDETGESISKAYTRFYRIARKTDESFCDVCVLKVAAMGFNEEWQKKMENDPELTPMAGVMFGLQMMNIVDWTDQIQKSIKTDTELQRLFKTTCNDGKNHLY